MKDLIDPNEKTLFVALLCVATLIWLALLIGTLGTLLIGLLIGFIFFAFAHSRLISHLRGNGAIVTAQQYPDLHNMLEECCLALEMEKTPTLVMLHMGGMFNAFATRFLGRHYVVLLSDVVDALEDEPEAIKFYIGHELGHIKRNHLFWMPILAPASWLPLIGSGYSRAREFTCDRHGRACCATEDAAVKAMAALAVGGKRWKTLNVKEYLKQAEYTKGFWMTLHEIISDYPWLVRRIARLHDKNSEAATLPRRNIFAWLPAIFIPRMNLMTLVVLYIFFIVLSGGILKGNELIKQAQEREKQAAAISSSIMHQPEFQRLQQ